MNDDWPDISDTPEQRALIAEHNERMRREYPNMVQIDPPLGDTDKEAKSDGA